MFVTGTDIFLIVRLLIILSHKDTKHRLNINIFFVEALNATYERAISSAYYALDSRFALPQKSRLVATFSLFFVVDLHQKVSLLDLACFIPASIKILCNS